MITKKILGTKEQYYNQTNDASVDLMKDYFHKNKMIACGPNSYAAGLHIAGWPLVVFTPGVQISDSILMIMHNRFNLPKFKEKRDLDYDKYPPNEVPQAYDAVGEILYNRFDVSKFSWGLDYEIIKNNVLNNIPTMMCGEFPAGGHYVLAVGFDDNKKVIIFNDPYPPQWEDKNGYNREMNLDFFEKNINKFKIEIYPFKRFE